MSAYPQIDALTASTRSINGGRPYSMAARSDEAVEIGVGHSSAQQQLLHGTDKDDGDSEEYRVYALRWLVLFTFAMLTITNALLWICFAPIQDLAAAYYGVSNTWINMLSVAFMALYLPGYFLAFWAMSKHGLRWGLCLAAMLQTLGAVFRLLSVIGEKDNAAKPNQAFILCMVGQCMAAVAQPMFTNAPARLAADWFGANQRGLATTIAAMSNPVGIAVGQLLPSALVDAHGGMRTLLLVSAAISAGTCVLCFLTIHKEPPTPPSRSSAERRAAKLSAAADASVPFWQSPLIKELQSLTHNRQFWVLMFGVGIGLGLFNAVATLIEQLVRPAGYNKDDAGTFGALIIGCGLVGAAIVGPILDATHAYNKMLKGGLFTAFAGTVFMLLMLRPGHYALVAVAFGVLGLVMLPLLPVCMECAAECTYPVSEDASSGLMLFAGNLIGIIMIVVVGAVIEDPYKSVFNPAAYTLVGFLFLAVVVVGLMYKGPLLRQAAEHAQSKDRAGLSSEGLETQLLM